MKVLIFIMNSIFLALMLAVALLFLVPLLPIDNNLELRIVESGSMEPAIMTGSLVAIWPSQTYGVGDVITFESQGSNVPTTHRVVDAYMENGQTWFVTKGDANEEADNEVVASSKIIGSVKLTVPYAGFILDFARQPLGFAFLIVLPACLVIFLELEKIWHELSRRKIKVQTVSPKKPAKIAVSKKKSVKKVVNRSYTIPVRSPEPTSMMDIATPVKYQAWTEKAVRVPLTLRVKKDSRLGQSLSRMASATVVIMFCLAAISTNFLESTVSYISDLESSLNNRLEALSLDFNAVPDDASFTFEEGILVGDDDGAVITSITLEPESSSARYDVRVEIAGGNPAFCNAIEADSVSPLAYDGPLTALLGTDLDFDSTWILGLSLPNGASFQNGTMCVLHVVLTAWHFDTLANIGYVDEERIPFSFSLIAPEYVPLDFTPTPISSSTPAIVSSSTNKAEVDSPEIIEKPIIKEEEVDEEVTEDTVIESEEVKKPENKEPVIDLSSTESEVKESVELGEGENNLE